MSVIEAPAPTTTTVFGDLYTRAADLLEEFDFCQNRISIPNDRLVTEPGIEAFCMYGAMLRARFDIGASDDDLVAACHALGFPGGLIDWNDVPGRTKAEVVARVRLAAERAREAEA